MNLSWTDHALIAGIVVAARAGGFVLTSRLVKRNMAWGQKAIGQLLSHAEWAHRAIRTIAEAMHVHIEDAPLVNLDDPPPTDVDWTDVGGPLRNGGGK